MGATPDEGFLVRTALNAVLEEWEHLSKASSAGQRYHPGQTCGQSFVRRKSGDLPRGKATTAGQSRWRKKRKRMQPLHQRNEGSKGRRRGTYPRSSALIVADLDTSPALVLRRRTKDLLNPRQQQQRTMGVMMTQPWVLKSHGSGATWICRAATDVGKILEVPNSCITYELWEP